MAALAANALPSEALKLYRVFKTVNVMLDKRGYVVDEKDKTMSKEVSCC